MAVMTASSLVPSKASPWARGSMSVTLWADLVSVLSTVKEYVITEPMAASVTSDVLSTVRLMGGTGAGAVSGTWAKMEAGFALYPGCGSPNMFEKLSHPTHSMTLLDVRFGLTMSVRNVLAPPVPAPPGMSPIVHVIPTRVLSLELFTNTMSSGKGMLRTTDLASPPPLPMLSE